jgi:hypothetical protein
MSIIFEKIINLRTIKILFPLSIILLIFLLISLFIKFTVTVYFITLNFLGVVLGIATYLYLIQKPSFNEFNIKNDKLNFALTIIFSFFISATIYSIYISNVYRVIEFYIFITVAMALLTFQALFFKISKKIALLILVQLVILHFVQRISLYLINGVPPWWDPYYHYFNSVRVYNLAHVPDYLGGYTYFPLYYILNSIIWLIPFGKVTFMYMLINSLIVSVSLFFAYIIVYRISNSIRVSLISTIVFSLIYSYTSFNSYTLHPFSFIFFIISFYSLIRIEENRKFIIILVLSSITMFLFHPTAAIIFAIVMLVLTFVLITYNKYLRTYSIIYFGLIIFYLFFHAFPFFSEILPRLIYPAYSLKLESPSTPYFDPNLDSLTFYTLSHAWYSIVIYLGTVGLLYAFINGRNFKSYFLALTALTIVAYNFIVLFSGTAVEQTIAILYILVPVSFLAGSFIVFKRKTTFALLLLLIVFAFFSSNLLTDDSPYFAKYSYPSQGIMYTTQQSFSLAKFILYTKSHTKIFGTIDPSILPYHFNGTLPSSIAYYKLSLDMNMSNSYIAISTYTIERWATDISPASFSNYLNFLIYKNNNDILFNNRDSYLIRISK